MSGTIIILIIIVSFILLGLIFFFVGFGIKTAYKKRKIRCIRQLSGIVVDIEETRSVSNDGMVRKSWYPIFEYEVDGQKIQKRSLYGGAQQDFYKGQQVNVFVNPLNLNEFYVPEQNSGMLGKLFMLIGICLLLVGIGVATGYYLIIQA